MNFLNLKAVLSLNGSGFALGLKRAESTSKQFAREIKSEFARAFGTAAIVAYGAKVVNLADEIIDLSDRLGVSTKALQEWAYAAKRSGSSIEAVTRFLEQLAIAREKALGGDANTLADLTALGVTDLSSVDVMGRQIGRTVRDGNVADLVAPLRRVGGRGASELIPAMKADIDAMAEAAAKAGQIMSDETLQGLKDVKTELQNLADTFMGPVAIAITTASKLVRGGVDIIKGTIGGYAAALGALFGGGGLKGAGEAFDKVVNDILAEREARERRAEEAVSARNAAAQANTGTTEDFGPIKDWTPKKVKEVAERAAQTAMERPQVNSWQQIGAAVRFTPENHGREIAKNTSEANRKLEELKSAIKTVSAGNFGGESGF